MSVTPGGRRHLLPGFVLQSLVMAGEGRSRGVCWCGVSESLLARANNAL